MANIFMSDEVSQLKNYPKIVLVDRNQISFVFTIVLVNRNQISFVFTVVSLQI